jgi:hypothetical protein
MDPVSLISLDPKFEPRQDQPSPMEIQPAPARAHQNDALVLVRGLCKGRALATSNRN